MRDGFCNDDHLALVCTQFTTLRRYTPEYLAALDLRAVPAAPDLLDAHQYHPCPECHRCQNAPGRCTYLVHPTPLEAAGLYRERPGPGFLLVLRPHGARTRFVPDMWGHRNYTDTAGFTDHLFALMNVLGHRFSRRIRNISDTRLYVPAADPGLSTLAPLIGGTINTKTIALHWDEILRLATSIKTGTLTDSLMMRKLGAYPRQNGPALALRELGRIERTLFLQSALARTNHIKPGKYRPIPRTANP